MNGGTGKLPRIETVEMLIKLDREEVRFWQQHFMQATFWLTAGPLAIVGFILNINFEKLGHKETVGVGGVVAIVVLATLYKVLATQTKDAIQLNRVILRMMERDTGLKTYEPLPQEAKKDHGTNEFFEEKWITHLGRAHPVLCMGAAILLAHALDLRPWVWIVVVLAALILYWTGKAADAARQPPGSTGQLAGGGGEA